MSHTPQTGRYEIIETLGRGGTSRVDKARDTIIGRTVALKRFLQGFGRNSEEQFLREAQTIGRLSHSSIAQLYDVNTDASGAPFLVMEYVSGKSLEEVLSRGAIPFGSAAVWAADVASALSYAHRAGIIHGDVKPSNIRVTEDDRVKLVDFGVARFASQVSGSDRVLGTPAYLSPEQIEGKRQDGRSDIFSLGIVLYEMLTGVRPFTGNSLGEVCAQILTANPEPPSKRNPVIPAALDRIVERCLAKNPEERYPSADEVARALYLVARCETGLAPKPKRPYWFQRAAHPRDLLAIASGILMLAGVVIGAGSLRDWIHSRLTVAIADVPAKTFGEARLAKGSQQMAAVPRISPQADNAVRKKTVPEAARKDTSKKTARQERPAAPTDPPRGQARVAR